MYSFKFCRSNVSPNMLSPQIKDMEKLIKDFKTNAIKICPKKGIKLLF